MRGAWNNGYTRTSLAGTALLGAAVVLTGCPGVGPKEGELRVRTPPFDVDIRWSPVGEGVPLPSGWTPIGGRTVCIPKKGGGQFCVTLCIAENSTDPDCIYVKLGSCTTVGLWYKYCREIVDNSPFDEPVECDADAEFEVYESLGEVSAIFDACQGLTLDQELVCTQIWDASIDGYISSGDWISAYGPGVDEGTSVWIIGTGENVAWDCYLLGISHFWFEDEGDEYEGGIGVTSEGLPVAVIALNGDVVHRRIVTRPQ